MKEEKLQDHRTMNASSLYVLAVMGSYKEADHMTFLCVHLSYTTRLH